MRNGHSSGTGPRILLECDHPSAVPSLTRSRCGGTTRTGLPSANSHAVWLNSTSGWRRPPKPKAQGPVASGPPWRGRACQAVDRSASRGLIDQSEPFPFPAWSSLPVHSPAPPKMQRSSRRMALTGSNLCGAESPPAYSGHHRTPKLRCHASGRGRPREAASALYGGRPGKQVVALADDRHHSQYRRKMSLGRSPQLLPGPLGLREAESCPTSTIGFPSPGQV
jgi:hypothetical protein